jgi:hypothetical protein
MKTLTYVNHEEYVNHIVEVEHSASGLGVETHMIGDLDRLDDDKNESKAIPSRLQTALWEDSKSATDHVLPLVI